MKLLVKLLVKFRWQLKKRVQRRCFPVKFAKVLRTPFFYRTPLVTVSLNSYLLRDLMNFSKLFGKNLTYGDIKIN